MGIFQIFGHRKYLLRVIQQDSRKHIDFGQAALEILEFKTIMGAKERSLGFIKKT
jgi:hypothetical protein